MKTLADFTLKLRNQEFAPIMLGGMGVDITSPELALAIARLNGIGHISDAMAPIVVDRHYHTNYVRDKFEQFKAKFGNPDKAGITFDVEALRNAISLLVSRTMEAKRGAGAVFINIMEKLSMGNPHETLRARLVGAMDAGIDGITLSAGLHMNSFDLVRDHPRFHDVNFGIIVSSVRALKIFMQRSARVGRLPDYIVVEGPLAGGHLGFPLNWRDFTLKAIVTEVLQFLQKDDLHIPVIPAGGIFTGSDAVEMMEMGAAGVQVATRFTVTNECSLPNKVKQAFFAAEEDDVVVNMISPTGYPMRMLRQSPAIGASCRPNCEALGYGLDTAGHCSYLDAYDREAAKGPNVHVEDKTCLCSQMKAYHVWTCGQNVYRLKDTTRRLPDGSYQLLTAEQVFNDYLYSEDHTIAVPEAEPALCLA